MPLGQNPPAEMKPAPLPPCHRINWGRDNFFKKIVDPFPVEIYRGCVIGQIRLPHVFHVFIVVLIQLYDLFNQSLIAGKIGAIQKTFRVELLGDKRVTPINRQTSCDHGIINLFRRITGLCGIFKTDVEFVGTQKFDLGGRSTTGEWPADVVPQSSPQNPQACNAIAFRRNQVGSSFYEGYVGSPRSCKIYSWTPGFFHGRLDA